ncbi:MAG: FKBP-type peptidyl-prolyl cis-trans isomerase [Prevotellaceae bacterium]|nr:FKBP-type peptidyl-prolyl cis-trans isomerase [Prevotellaceae bacterium]
MKFKAILLTAALAGLTFTSCNSNGISASSSAVDSVSYAFGINIGESLNKSKIDGLNPDIIARGIADMLQNDGANAKVSYEESIEIIQTYFQKMQEEMLTKNIEEGKAFLEKNGKEEGVTTTESGLQYKVTTEGTGPKPTANDEVEVHYRGTLLNGEEFDSSYESGQPVKFRLNSVIKGWTEGLQLVNEGSKVTLWIPSELAYGEQGAGANI